MRALEHCPDCPQCRAAADGMWHGFAIGCRGCAARAASRSPHYRRVQLAGRLDRAYRALLDSFGLTHEEVKQAAATDALGKEAA